MIKVNLKLLIAINVLVHTFSPEEWRWLSPRQHAVLLGFLLGWFGRDLISYD